ncbi:ABC transporter ATP-binding protein [Streptomyces sp. NPDC101132]|uniref:ABC transporter ATP-binding protein n=1 Tax=Streptomyces sp. NPDC101132 TaxID=3366110 RepID=UPI00382CFE27
MAGAVTLVIAASVLGLAQPVLAGRIIDRVRTSEPIAGLVLTLTLLFVAQTLIDTAGRYLLERTGESVVRGLRQLLVRRLIRLQLPALLTHRSGDLISRATGDTLALRDSVTRGLVEIAVGALTVTGATALMVAIDPVLFLVVLGVFAVAALGVTVVLNRIREAAEQSRTAVGVLTADLERSLSAIRTIRIHQAEQSETERLLASADAAFDAGVRGARLAATAHPAIQLAASGSFLLVLVVGGMRVASGELQLGELVAVLLYATYLVMPLGNLLEGLTTLKSALGALQRVQEALDLPIESDDGTPGAIAAAVPGAPALVFADVRFSYDDRPALSGVSFEVARGSRTALVGTSGSGKSTILSLICRFYEPTGGTISYLGHDAAALTRVQCRQLVSLVEQSAPVLHGSIRENLCMGRSADAAEIDRVLRQVNLHDWVETLPDGVDTQVGEHGSQLSGGQRQRLAIARALLTRPALLLLDEPTSSLDAENEKTVMDGLRRLHGDCVTVLIVAHRISTVRDADHILVVDDGEVVATGSHHELVRTSEHYRLLLGTQITDDEHTDFSGVQK